jgi:hypothetical protein
VGSEQPVLANIVAAFVTAAQAKGASPEVIST